jgi:hypothetical protein
MTYTFKLARRLAVSQMLAILPAILVAACGGDATAPESGAPGPLGDRRNTVSVNPSYVTIETNQLIRFLAHGWNDAGDSVYAPISWHVTGGTMLPDGRFSSATVGTFLVTGTASDRGEERIDTSVVTVVRRPSLLSSIEIFPRSVTLAAGAARKFLATGRQVTDWPVPVGVTWTVTGGSVDAGGTYIAGDTAGTYQVIATHTSLTVADTATVTVTAPPPPPPAPPAPPEEPPAPILTTVILSPSSATLAPSATRQFNAYGTTASGDTIPVPFEFQATGGTLTGQTSNQRLYAAGSLPGSYRVIAASGGLADTATVTVTNPLGSGPGGGIPYGSFHLPPELYRVRGMSGALRVLLPPSASADLAVAKANNMRLVVSLPDSRDYYTNSDGTFNLNTWKSQMNRWRSHAALLKEYYDNGTILLNYLLDEPNCVSCWGGRSISHADLLEASRYAKEMLPFLPTVIRVPPGWLKTTPSWPHLDAAWAQTEGPLHVPSNGMTPEQFVARNVTDAKAIKVALVLGMNTINGGDGTSRISGTYAIDPNLSDAPSGKYRYQMSAAEFERSGKVYAAEPYACAVINWRYSPTMTNKPGFAQQFDLRSDVQAAAVRIAGVAADRAGKSCRKPS